MYQFFPYIILTALSFAMLIFLAAFALNNRRTLAVNEFVFGVLTLAWWVFCQAFELMALAMPVKLFWANMLYIGSTLSTFAYLLLTARFTGYNWLIRKTAVRIILFVSALFLVLIFTDQYHGLMRSNIHLDTTAFPYIIDKDYGLAYPLFMLFTYGMNSLAIILILTTIVRKHSVYRRKAQFLLAGVSVIPLSNAIYMLGIFPGQRFDITPALFWVSALVISWGISRHRLLKVIPIARDLLVERIGNGIIVTDKDNFVVDINQAALNMFQVQRAEVLDTTISEIAAFAGKFEPDRKGPSHVAEFMHLGQKYLYEIDGHLVKDEKGRTAGALWVVDDITEMQNNMEKIVQQEKSLSVMRERERLARSLHDGLGQVMGYYNTQGQAVREYLLQEKYSEALKLLAELIDVARGQNQMIREQIADIRGISMANKGFAASVKQIAVDFTSAHGIPVSISLDENLPKDFPAGGAMPELMRIIQEALKNIEKHAGKCRAEIACTRDGDCVEICIADTGVGFDPVQDTGAHSYGLAIMKERAAEIGASLTVNSAINIGTKIILKVRDGEPK